jgi:predicted transcriptional regulator
VPVERIATSLLDLLIEEHDDLRSLPGAPLDQGRLSGMIDPSHRTIWVDRAEAARSPRRRRFTIAHEVGHWRLHVRPGAAVVFDRSEDITDVRLPGDERSQLTRREAEANAFARELLMPEPLVREQAAATGCNLPALAERFEVSVPAMRLRLRLLGLLPAGMM